MQMPAFTSIHTLSVSQEAAISSLAFNASEFTPPPSNHLYKTKQQLVELISE